VADDVAGGPTDRRAHGTADYSPGQRARGGLLFGGVTAGRKADQRAGAASNASVLRITESPS
jgi:hypothetical protein